MTLTSMGLKVHYLMAVLVHYCQKLAEEVLQDHRFMELDEQL